VAFHTTTNGTTSRSERMRIDNTGYVGIGTPTPTSPLTVAGTIQSTTGGFKFPDGTVQTKAGLSGTVAIANGGTGATTQQAAINALTGPQIGGFYLRSDGTNATLSNIQPWDVPALPYVAYTNISNTFSADQLFGGNLFGVGDVNVDASGLNTGLIGNNFSPALRFGVGGGEGIASNRASDLSGNQYGLDFYTGFLKRISIFQNGQVGIGSTSPLAQLEVDGGTANGGVLGTSGGRSVSSTMFLGSTGVQGDAGATCCWTGIVGTADENDAGYFVNNGSSHTALSAENDTKSSSSALVLDTYGGNFGGECKIDVSGNLTCTGKVSAAAAVDGGARQVALYSMQSPENWFEDFGSAALSNGAATITLEATFAQTVNTGAEYHVFLTPNGDCKGLYVARKSADSFEVRELGGGQSSVAFDYRIVARRAGSESVRLEDLTQGFQKQAEHRERVHHPVRPSTAPQVTPVIPKPSLRSATRLVTTQPR
jgi:hypothetical protein